MHEKLRILCIIPTMGPGGAERVMSHLLTHLVRRHDVTLLTFEAPEAASFYALPDGLNHLRLDTLGGGILRRVMRIVSRPPLLRQAVRELRPDVVVSFMDTTNITAVVSCLGLGIPVVVSERIDPSRHAIGWIKGAMRRCAYPRARLIVVQTRRVAGYFPASLQPKIRVIGNPIPAPPARADTTASAPDAAGRKRVIAVGRCEPQKGYDRLIEAFVSIASDHAEWDLVIFGDGPERPRLEARIRELGMEGRIRLKGVARDVFAELAASQILAFPSRYEGFPNALAEGLAAGLPAVGYRGVSGVEELIVDGTTGLLVDEGAGAEGFAQALSTLMARADLRERLGHGARRHVAQWAPEHIFAKWDDVLAEAVEPRRRTD